MTVQSNISTGGAGTEKTLGKGGRTVSVPTKIPVKEALYIFNVPNDGIRGTTGGSGRATVSRPKTPWYNPFVDMPFYGVIRGYAPTYNTPRNY